MMPSSRETGGGGGHNLSRLPKPGLDPSRHSACFHCGTRGRACGWRQRRCERSVATAPRPWHDTRRCEIRHEIGRRVRRRGHQRWLYRRRRSRDCWRLRHCGPCDCWRLRHCRPCDRSSSCTALANSRPVVDGLTVCHGEGGCRVRRRRCYRQLDALVAPSARQIRLGATTCCRWLRVASARRAGVAATRVGASSFRGVGVDRAAAKEALLLGGMG